MGMEPFVRNFIRSSLVWFGVGILLGLAGMVGGFILRVWVDWGAALLAVGGGLSALGAFLFIYNIWMTLGPVKRADLVGIGQQPGVPPGMTRPNAPLHRPGAPSSGG